MATNSIVFSDEVAVANLLEEVGIQTSTKDVPVGTHAQMCEKTGYDPATISPRELSLGLDED